jgi:phosphopantetheinyl transferase
VVWSALSPGEQKRLAAGRVADHGGQFLRMWTLKEAYVKCLGAGASVDFADLHTSFEPLAVTHGAQNGAAADYRFHQQQWRAGRDRHWVALALASRRS